MDWLDENGFPALRQLLRDPEGEAVAVLRSVPTGEPARHLSRGLNSGW